MRNIFNSCPRPQSPSEGNCVHDAAANSIPFYKKIKVRNLKMRFRLIHEANILNLKYNFSCSD